ncbi:hypothetical protein NHU_01217 [Rhodovulum sulfidophilum]|uniref:Uncharacterized protein n=1 Tax=Rhodovulum sulfidophilum TaxID=35806 RepID=A0A0D6AZU8_RHOSU|nr:hypothetical protein NHU_01217 [Rhodovulum sulfidophilum]
MRLTALHVNRAEPACSQNLSNSSGILSVCLVAHRGKCGADLPSFHADGVEPLTLKPEEQMLAQRTCFKAHPHDRMRKRIQASGDLRDFARQFTLQTNRPTAIGDAHGAGPKRNIQSNKVIHSLSPFLTAML